MNSKQIFANNLNAYMRINNKERKQVCKDLNINYYTFCDWCNAKKQPRMDKVVMLAKYFGINISDLIEEHHIYKDKYSFELRKKNEYQKIWDNEMQDVELTENEVLELVKYAKYLISQRKEG